ncbi:unnamed protein product [Discosporangium mesarthrocarpum]
MGLDLTEFQQLTGFLLNECPDAGGHFYPPLPGGDEDLAEQPPTTAEELAGAGGGIVSHGDGDNSSGGGVGGVGIGSVSGGGGGGGGGGEISMGGSDGGSGVSRRLTAAAAAAAATTTGPSGTGTGMGTGAGKRRSSNKEEQQRKRRERNRVLARRTRLRKKYFFQSLQKQVASLQRENDRLKGIVIERCPATSEAILRGCHTELPTVVAECASQATALINRSGFLLMKALQASQPSFCVTDPLLPDNPIVYASEGFIELTGYTRQQVLGRNCRFLQGPDTDPEAVSKIRKGVEEGIDTSVFLRQYKADGTVFWNHVFVAALRDAENHIINYVGIQHKMEKEPSPELIASINQEREFEEVLWQGSDGEEDGAGGGGGEVGGG